MYISILKLIIKYFQMYLQFEKVPLVASNVQVSIIYNIN